MSDKVRVGNDNHNIDLLVNSDGSVNLGYGGAPVAAANPLPAAAREFAVAVEITRSAATAAYSAGQIINGADASVLPALDFPTATGLAADGLAGRKIVIHTATVLSSNGGVSTVLAARLHFFTAGAPQTVADYTAFAPTYARLKADGTATCEDVSTLLHLTANTFAVGQPDVRRQATLGAGGLLYVCLVAANAYTPADGETLTVTVRGAFGG